MWNERFAEPGYAYGTEPNGFLVSVAAEIAPGRTLCLAEGEGRNAVFLAGLGCEVTAVDNSSVGLAKAEALAAERGVTITTVNRDLADYDIEDGTWNAIVSVFCHLPPPLRSELHRRCVRGLAPGGAFVLVGFTPRQLELATGGPRSVELLVEPDEIRSELEGLQPVISREVQRPVVEGRYHTGTSAVFEFFGVKLGNG
jgi:SAM-dependent methyltransferase